MKHQLLALLFTLISSLQVYADVKEIRSMREILPFVTPNTVVVFDLDNTVIEPLQTIGSDQFFGFLKDKAQKGGLADREATLWALKAVTPVAPAVPIRPVERLTPQLIAHLQSRHITVIALTARPPQWANGTLRQLHSIGVDFSRSAPSIHSETIKAQDGSLYTQGVLFMAVGNKKGPILRGFLKGLHVPGNRVVFVDDRPSNVASVEETFKTSGYENINFRYGGADPIVKQFNSAIAETEWKCFSFTKSVISDKRAQAIIDGQASCTN